VDKRLNTIIFILAATVFNVLTVIVSIILLLLLFNAILPPEHFQAWVLGLIFIASLALSFVVYRYALKFILKKIDVDKYFDPLFVRRNIKRN